MKKSKRKAKAKPIKAWAHVNIETNKVTWICGLNYNREEAKLVMEGTPRKERLARVEIKEV